MCSSKRRRRARCSPTYVSSCVVHIYLTHTYVVVRWQGRCSAEAWMWAEMMQLLHWCPHTTIYLSSCYCMCPHTAIYVSSYYYICGLMLLCMCPYATVYVSSYYIFPHATMCVLILLYLYLHTTIYVFILLCMCPHTTIYVSSYYCMCPHTPVYVSSYY